MSVDEHRARAEGLSALRAAVVTVSDTRTLDTDASGRAIIELLERAGHRVAERTIVPDDPEKISRVLGHWLDAEIEAVILTGGTGIAPRDGTVEVVRRVLDVELPGFGEIFRHLSWEQIGAAAFLSRALAGVARGKAVFSLPGSTTAVRLAMESLILPELSHIVSQLRGA